MGDNLPSWPGLRIWMGIWFLLLLASAATKLVARYIDALRGAGTR